MTAGFEDIAVIVGEHTANFNTSIDNLKNLHEVNLDNHESNLVEIKQDMAVINKELDDLRGLNKFIIDAYLTPLFKVIVMEDQTVTGPVPTFSYATLNEPSASPTAAPSAIPTIGG